MLKSTLKGAVVGMLALIAASSYAAAQTVADIKSRGRILVAMDLGSPPYAFTDAQQKPQGSDVETAQLLADHLGVKLEIVPTTGQGRIPSLLSRKADVVIATFSYTRERAEAVDYSDPYSFIRSVIFARKDLSIRALNDLVGKRIGIARGTTSERVLPNILPPGFEIVRYDDDATMLAALASGQVESVNTADNRLLALEERFPGRFEIKLDIETSYLGIGLRKGNPELLRELNAFVEANMANGRLKASYERWLRQPLPALPRLSEIRG